MIKFQVGDMVKIVDYQYGIQHMKELLGKTAKIDAVIGKHFYRVAGWGFREDWLEPAYTRESIE